LSPRRPPRAWIGSPVPVDATELAGPRGLTAEVLRGDDEGAAAEGGAAFWWAQLTPERQGRIQSVVDARLKSVTVVLDRLFDPHNTAAILRSAEALGLCKAHVAPHEGEDGIAHRRVTQDADKWLDVDLHASGAAAAASLRAAGFEVWAGHLEAAACLYTELPADRPVALLFGNEHEGPCPSTLSACTGTFRIPMAGFTRSFNVSVAAGIALAHQTSARRHHLGAAGDLPGPERVLLRDRFTLLAARLARRVKSGR
jgi:tRNA (guanosine-2'-O-)-methyltransferase